MCVGVAALILILSVFNGLESLVVSLYDTFNPDLKVTPKEGKIFIPQEKQIEELRALDGVTEVAFVLEELAVLRYEDKITNVRLKGVDEAFAKVAQIADTAEFVLSISGGNAEPQAAARGKEVFAEQCAACHGDEGKGNTELGSPNLTDRIWLYGGSREAIVQTIRYSRAGVMPTWEGRLSPETLKQLTVYVHSLGGGQ